MCRLKVALLLAVIIFLSLVSLASAGEPRPAPQLKHRTPVTQSAGQSVVTLKVTTNLVVLDVIATDAKGKAVTDLKAGDFSLLEDGKEQKISIFQLQQPAAAPVNVKTQAPLAPNLFTNVDQTQSAGARNVIVLDAWRSSPANQMFAISQIIKFVKEMRAGEPLAIFEFGGRGVLMLQDFTTDKALLLEAAKKIKPMLSLVQYDPGNTGHFSQSGLYRANMGATFEIEALQDFAASLSAYPGRKNLIWISDSMAANPYAHGYGSGAMPWLDRALVLSAFDFVENQNGLEINKTARAMIDSQVAVYPVDPTGVEGVPVQFTAAYGRSPMEGISGFRGFQDPFVSNFSFPESPLFRGSTYRRDVYRQMDDLATRTGGKAYYSRNDLAHAIGDGIRDGSTYYELAYYPSNRNWDGAFRYIDVKVNRPGIKVRYRPGYSAVDPASYTKRSVEMQNADLRRALNLSTPVETGLTFYAQVTPPSQKENQVAVQYAIFAQGIDFEPGTDGRQHASIDCVAQAFTDKGTIVKASSNTYQAALTPDSFQRVSQSGFPCMQKLDLPAGNYVLKLAARDNNTGAIGTVNAKVIVPQMPANNPGTGKP